MADDFDKLHAGYRIEEVKAKVVAAVKDEKAKNQREQTAKEIIASAKTPADLKAAAAKYGLEAKAEANYKVGTALADLGSSTILDDPLYNNGKASELLSAPISPFEIVVGYVGAAATKSIVLGLIILATAAFFVPLEIAHPLWMAGFLVLTALT